MSGRMLLVCGGVGLAVCGLIGCRQPTVPAQSDVSQRHPVTQGVTDTTSEIQLAFSTVTEDEGLMSGALWLCSLPSGRLQRLVPELSAFGFCFGPNGRKVAFLGCRPPACWPSLDVWLLDLVTGQTERVTTDFWGAYDSTPVWRPGTVQVIAARIYNRSQEALAKHIVPGDGGLWLVDVESGACRPLIQPSDSEFPVNLHPRLNGDGSMLACIRSQRYPAVFEVDHPEQWYGIDPTHRPTDWMWKGASRTLFFGASCRGDLGGIWQWNVTRDAPVVSPLSDPLRLDDVQTARAMPLFGQGKSIHALAPAS